MKKTFENLAKKEKQEKVSNRLTISVALAALLAFIILVITKLTSTFANEYANAGYVVMTVFAGICFVGMIVLYVLSNLDKTKCKCEKLKSLKYKERFRNYAHMSLMYFLIFTYICFNFLTRKIAFLSVERIPWLAIVKRVALSVKVSYWLIGIFVVISIAYHFYLYYKNDTNKKRS